MCAYRIHPCIAFSSRAPALLSVLLDLRDHVFISLSYCLPQPLAGQSYVCLACVQGNHQEQW